MTIVTNIDGTYHATGAADHCKHGVYVGGCGYDFMCGACEDGWPDETLREAIRNVDRHARRTWDLWDALVSNDAIDTSDDAWVPSFEAWFDDNHGAALAYAVDNRDRIAKLCDGLDDDDYLARIHRAAIEAERAERAERAEAALTYGRAVDIARSAGVEQEFIDDATRTWRAIDWSGPVRDIADDLDFICELLDLSEFAPLMHDQYLHAGRLA